MTVPNTPFPTPPPVEPNGRSVLIVDDERVIRLLARTTLAMAGFAVVEAGDAATALQAVKKATTPFDLILLDLSLGDIDGADLISLFRLKSPGTRILVVSGHAEVEVEGIGADGFLAKPFNKVTLNMAVWRTLTPKPAPSPDGE